MERLNWEDCRVGREMQPPQFPASIVPAASDTRTAVPASSSLFTKPAAYANCTGWAREWLSYSHSASTVNYRSAPLLSLLLLLVWNRRRAFRADSCYPFPCTNPDQDAFSAANLWTKTLAPEQPIDGRSFGRRHPSPALSYTSQPSDPSLQIAKR